jgi:hypothetical protein
MLDDHAILCVAGMATEIDYLQTFGAAPPYYLSWDLDEWGLAYYQEETDILALSLTGNLDAPLPELTEDEWRCMQAQRWWESSADERIELAEIFMMEIAGELDGVTHSEFPA